MGTLSALNPLLRELISRAEEVQRAGLTPRVAFDCDQTLIDGDIGEATLASLTLSGGLPTQSEWWSPLQATLGAEALHALKAKYQLARATGEVSIPLFQDIWEAYEALCKADIHAGYLFAATLWCGTPSHQVAGRSQQAVVEALSQDLTPCPSTGGLVSRGVRVRSVMTSLIGELERAGVEVWVVSSSQRALVQAVAPHLQLSPTRVLGIDVQHEQGRSGVRPVEPCPVAEGKSERFLAELGEPPIGMFGDSRYDLPLMQTAGWGALIDHNNPALARAAEALGVHVIPASLVSQGS